MALDYDVLTRLMEQKLDELYQAAGRGRLPELGRADREMLFAAIARAVVEHLHVRAEVDVTLALGVHRDGIIK